MTEEFTALTRDLDSAFFRYAHITGSVELYMLVLANPELQRVISKVISGSETEWTQIHRFMIVDGQSFTWYPELPAPAILAAKNTLLGFMYGITLSRMIGDLEFYLGSVLKNHFGHVETSGSSWDRFVQKTTIDLLNRRHGTGVYTLLQERHKIEHNQAQIDRTFLARLTNRKIEDARKEGDHIEKSHIDVLVAHQSIREFAEDVDVEVSRLLPIRGGV